MNSNGDVYIIKTFRCYSANLKDFLKHNGEPWIIIALDIVEPHKQYWLFERTPQFELLMKQWRETKPN